MSNQHGPIEKGVEHGALIALVYGIGWVVDRAIETQAPTVKSQLGNQLAAATVAILAGKDFADSVNPNNDHTV